MPAGRARSSEALPAEEFRRLLEAASPGFGISLDSDVASRLGTFLAELDVWRRTVNLTGRLSARDLVGHALESVVGESLLPAGAAVVDIGAGGGFPGVPLAIRRPDLSFTWLEPRKKRTAFLAHVARVVPVPNALVRSGRVEDLEDQTFDYGTVRGVRLDVAVLNGGRFLRAGGGLLAWTTRAEDLAISLEPAGLELQETLEVPRSRQRLIALFRMVPRGTVSPRDN